MSTIRVFLLPLIATTALAIARAGAEGDGKVLVDDSGIRQAQLKRAFENLRSKLAVLAGRMEGSSDAKEREKAKAIRAALREASTRGTEAKFDSLIRALNTNNADKNLDVLSQAIKDNKELRDDLRKIIDLLSRDDRDRYLADKRLSAEKLLATLKDLRDTQARMQAKTERGKNDPKDLNNEQKKITEKTKGVLNDLNKPSDSNAPEDEKNAEAIRKPVGQANEKQKLAEGKLGQGDQEGAGEAQGKAVGKLDEAIRQLEEQLLQIRQEEKERKLEALLARVKRMLKLELEIREGTESLYRKMPKDEKPGVELGASANKLAEKQLANLRDGEAALKVLRDDGSAVAFVEVFEHLMKDMDTANRRFERVEFDALTLTIVTDIVETLKEMVGALEKAIKENKPTDGPRSPGRPGPKEKLVNLLQQLKMVYAMQKRVNDRTQLYGKRYSGEQVPTPADEREKKRFARIEAELAELAGRQTRIAKVTKDIGKDAENGEQRID